MKANTYYYEKRNTFEEISLIENMPLWKVNARLLFVCKKSRSTYIRILDRPIAVSDQRVPLHSN